jgi:hypothetical protein
MCAYLSVQINEKHLIKYYLRQVSNAYMFRHQVCQIQGVFHNKAIKVHQLN